MGLSIGWDEYLGLVLNQISITTLNLYGKVQENNVGVGLANQMYGVHRVDYDIQDLYSGFTVFQLAFPRKDPFLGLRWIIRSQIHLLWHS